MSDRGVSAIVLAGGRSSRFGRNKLAEPIVGKPLLDHAIDGVQSFATDIVVVIAPDDLPPSRPDVRVVRDAVAYQGPLTGLLAGLGAARQRTVLVTAGDMPGLVLEVAHMLLAALAAPGAEAAVLEDAGRPRPLPMALARDVGRRAAQGLIDAGERRLRTLVDGLATTVVPEATWRVLDPDARSLRDIDTPDDLP
jgi:molybdopterin-guanine dinucleotide biosynthesis protein A